MFVSKEWCIATRFAATNENSFISKTAAVALCEDCGLDAFMLHVSCRLGPLAELQLGPLEEVSSV